MSELEIRRSYKSAKTQAEDWSGWTDPRLRRKVQNRLNQRLSRTRKASQRRPQLERPLGISSLRPKILIQSSEDNKCDSGENGSIMVNFQVPREIEYLKGLSPSLQSAGSRRMFHLAYAILWPKMGPSTAPTRETYSTTLFQTCIKEPIILDGTVQTMAKIKMRHGQHPDDMEALCEAQLRVSKALRQGLAEGVITDTVLAGIASLASQLVSPEPEQRPVLGLFKSIGIENLGGLAEFGHFRRAPEHYDMFLRLLHSRGGSATITSPGVQSFVTVADLTNTCWTLSAPGFALCPLYQKALEEEFPKFRPPMREVQAFRVDRCFKKVLLYVKMLCRMVDQYCDEVHNGARSGSECLKLIPFRDIVLHQILSLPRERCDLEICRLAVLVFTFGVLYPLPQRNTILAATEMLSRALRSPRLILGQDAEFLFWATTIGGMAAGPRPEYRYDAGATATTYNNQLVELSTKLELKTWTEARQILSKFLWLDRACDDGGHRVWLESHAYYEHDLG